MSAVEAFYQCFLGSEGPMEVQVVTYLVKFLRSLPSHPSYSLRRGVRPTHRPATVPVAPCLCPSAPPRPAQPPHTHRRTAWQGSEMTCWMPSLRVRSLILSIDIHDHPHKRRCLGDVYRRYLEECQS